MPLPLLVLIFVCMAGSANASAAGLSVSPPLVSPGRRVIVSWNGVSSPTSTDWVGLVTASELDEDAVRSMVL
jgi:hypothetical protein